MLAIADSTQFFIFRSEVMEVMGLWRRPRNVMCWSGGGDVVKEVER